MECKPILAEVSLLLGACVLLGAPLVQPQAITTASRSVTLTVTAVGKTESGTTISKDDVQLFLNTERKQIGDWKNDNNLFLAILIDDSIDSSVASNWSDLREFLLAQSPTVHIAVGYIRNNTTTLGQDFTADHELAAKALRMPMGTGAIGSSPYLGTLDFLNRWPQTGPHRSILLVTSGIDFFRGPAFGPIYPDVDRLIQLAERQNTNIWTIYYPSSGHRRSSYRVYYAQNNLGKLSEETGGEFYALAAGVPVSLKPYFDEIAMHLDNQYLVTFAGSGGSKGKYQNNIKVKTELPGLEFFTSNAVYLPPSK